MTGAEVEYLACVLESEGLPRLASVLRLREAEGLGFTEIGRRLPSAGTDLPISASRARDLWRKARWNLDRIASSWGWGLSREYRGVPPKIYSLRAKVAGQGGWV